MKNSRIDIRVSEDVKLKIKDIAKRKELSVTELLLLGVLKLIKEEELNILERNIWILYQYNI